VAYTYKKAIVTDFIKIAKLDREAWRIWIENALVFIAEKL